MRRETWPSPPFHAHCQSCHALVYGFRGVDGSNLGHKIIAPPGALGGDKDELYMRSRRRGRYQFEEAPPTIIYRISPTIVDGCSPTGRCQYEVILRAFTPSRNPEHPWYPTSRKTHKVFDFPSESPY